MRFLEYASDKKYLILFYITLMTFISLVAYLDSTVKVALASIFYMNFVAFIIFLFYFFGGYLFHKKYYMSIIDTINNQKGDIANRFPEPKTNEQNLYNELLRGMYNEQNERIEKLFEEKKDNIEFITSWVHEIKTPIAVSRLIIDSNKDSGAYEILESLEEELSKIDGYVEQALYYSRTDAFFRDYFINETNLKKLVTEIVKKHAKTFISKKIKIDIGDIDLNVTTDKKWLFYIIDQLITNSLKYTSQNGEIKIYLYKDQNEKRLVIEDNGIGIRAEDIDRVFDKGFTGHNGRENIKSTGMGLYLAKKLSRKLGHDITVESVYGSYTKAYVHFLKLMDYHNVTKV